MIKVLTILLVFISSLAYAECEQAAELYEKALNQPLDKKIDSINKILEQGCKNYAFYYELGHAYHLKGRYREARRYFTRAVRWAESSTDKARSYHALGASYFQDNDMASAALCYKESLKLHRNTEVERTLMEIEKKQGIVPSEQIVARLLTGRRLAKAIGVKPTMDFRIHFEFDSYKLTPESIKQSDEIAKAMKHPGFKGVLFYFVGHADVRGTHEYNDGLSQKRVDAVRNYIVSKHGINVDSINISWKGKRQPLYSEDTEEAHAFNRRVEISLVQVSVAKGG